MRKKLRKSKVIDKIALLTILFIGLILRLIPALRLEFWFDETFTFFTKDLNFWEVIFYDPPHPPFFYWLVRFWSQLNTSQLFLRIPLLIFFLISCYLIFKIGKNINLNKYFPLTVSLFFSLHILMIEIGIEFKMYSLIVLLMLFSIFSLFRILQKQKKWVVVFCVTNLLGILTDYAFIWYFIGLFISFLIIYFLNHFIKFRDDKEMKSLLFAFIFSIILMMIWLPVFIMNFQKAFINTGHLYGDYSFSTQKIKDATKFLFSIPYWLGDSIDFIFYFLYFFSNLAYFICTVVYFPSKKLEKIFFWLIIGAFFYFSRNLAICLGWFLPHIIFEAKNSIVVSLFSICSLAGIVSLLLESKRLISKIAGLVLLLGLVIIYGWVYFRLGYYKNSGIWHERYSYKDAAEYLKKEANFSQDKLFFIKPWNNITFNYFFFDYFKNKYNSNLTYNLGNPEDFALGIPAATFWLVNFENYDLTENEAVIFNFFKNCDLENNPICYKKAILYKCEIK